MHTRKEWLKWGVFVVRMLFPFPGKKGNRVCPCRQTIPPHREIKPPSADVDEVEQWRMTRQDIPGYLTLSLAVEVTALESGRKHGRGGERLPAARRVVGTERSRAV